MNKQAGITMIALVMTIIIMLIIMSIVIRVGTKTVADVKDEDIITNMITIKSKAKIVLEQYNFKDIESLVGTKYLEAEGFQKGNLNDSFSSLSEEEQDKLYIWTNEDLANQGLSSISIDSENFYVIYYNDENIEIYYSQEINGEYALSAINAAKEVEE